jgi:cytidylate kinase
MIVAIDGPAAAGKGTLARRIAEALGFAHLDTGALYRAVGLGVLRAGQDPADAHAALAVAEALDPAGLSDPVLREEETGKAASIVSVHPQVRAALLKFQHNFARNPPNGAAGAVLEGRDIGTVVCPDADVKLFIDADLEVRAERRLAELRAQDPSQTLGAVRAEMAARDERDRNRANSPLEAASDAHLLDTTVLDIDGAFEAAMKIIGGAER